MWINRTSARIQHDWPPPRKEAACSPLGREGLFVIYASASMPVFPGQQKLTSFVPS